MRGIKSTKPVRDPFRKTKPAWHRLNKSHQCVLWEIVDDKIIYIRRTQEIIVSKREFNQIYAIVWGGWDTANDYEKVWNNQEREET